jgi:hypothetical protein
LPLAAVLKVAGEALAQEHRVVSFKHPLAGTVTKCAGGLIALKEI